MTTLTVPEDPDKVVSVCDLSHNLVATFDIVVDRRQIQP